MLDRLKQWQKHIGEFKSGHSTWRTCYEVGNMMKTFNEFDRLYQELKNRSGNDASRIEMLVKNSRDGLLLVGSLYFWAREFESERAKHRFLPNVPHWFIERYRSYKENFEPEVDRVYGRLVLLAFIDDEIHGVPASEILRPDGSPSPPKKHDENEIPGWFDPGKGAEAVDDMIDYVWQEYWNLGEYVANAELLRTGLDAWEWFTETVGIDLAKIEERSQKLPRALVPLHMERTAAGGATTALTDLLDDATKAYVFGLPAAAIAMCRTVCERVLKEFYFGDEKTEVGLKKDEKTEVCFKKEVGLKKMAILAEKRYEHLSKLRLPFYIDKANEVMHRYRGGQLSEDQLETVRQFLETTKTLIELAPPTPKRSPI